MILDPFRGESLLRGAVRYPEWGSEALLQGWKK